MLLPLLALALGAPVFQTDFAAAPPELRLLAKPPGVAAARDGVLVLDLSAAQTGKLAAAALDRDLPVPCRITWDQRVASDSPHAYWSGIRLTGSFGAPLWVRLGGAGVKHGIDFPDITTKDIKPGTWVHFELQVERSQQRLRVTARDGGELLGAGVRRVPAPQPPLRLLFYSNATPEELPAGDTYAQDRGRHEFDNLRIDPVEPAQVRPGDPYDVREPVVFNRALRWRATPAGPLAYDEQDLPLTGAAAVSNWAVGDAVQTTTDGDRTVFRRAHLLARGPDRMVLRQLQFHLGQHPVLHYDLRPSNARARLLVTFTCPESRQAVVLAEVPWSAQAQTGDIDLPAALARWGEQRVWAELDFILEVTAPEGIKDGFGELAATLGLPRRDAVVAPTHIVRPADAGPVPISAFVAAPAATKVLATHTTPATELTLRDGLWTGQLTLGAGVHAGEVVATVAGRELRQRVEVRVSPRPFVVAKAGDETYSLADGTRLPPLLGDLFAWTMWDNPNSPKRRMITGPESWSGPGRPVNTKWRSLTGRELEQRIAYQADECGARVLRLVPNTTPYESMLDAGGHIAPHGLEQLQRLLTVFEQHRVVALINLFHYQYGSAATGVFPPIDAYLKAGYHDPADFTKPPAVALEQAYLTELLAAIGQDPAVLGYTLFGENDDLPGPDWANSMTAFTKAHSRQLVVFEQGGGLQNHGDLQPDRWQPFAAARDGGVGYRTYYSDGTPVDACVNANARWFAQRQPAFLAEACSDGPGWYRDRITWLSDNFRTQFRDNLWASLCAPQAMSLYWSVCFIERERRLPTLIAERINWQGFRRARGQLAVVVPAANRKLLPLLCAVDDECSRAGVMYDIVAPGADRTGYAGTIDLSNPPAAVTLPDAVRQRALLTLTPGNAATLLADAAGTTLLVYVRSVVAHEPGPGYGVGVKELHRQRTAERDVTIDVRTMSDQAQVTVWDVDSGKVMKTGRLGDLRTLALGRSKHDYAVLIQRP